MHQRFFSCVTAVSFLMLVGCTSSCGPSVSDAPKRKPVLEFTSFPAIAGSYGKLSPSQQEAFAKLANDEQCPCNCAKSFAGCLQEGTKCKAAVILADYVAAKLATVSAEAMVLPLLKEIGAGYGGKVHDLNLTTGHKKGSANPKVTIVEFADFDCPHCKVTSPVVDQFLAQHKDEVLLVYKYLPRNTQAGEASAFAAQAASRQGKFWEMHDALFASDKLTDDRIVELAKKIPGLKMDVFEKDRKDQAIKNEVMSSKVEAISIGVQETPAFFFNGRRFLLFPDISGLEMRLAMELARNESSCD